MHNLKLNQFADFNEDEYKNILGFKYTKNNKNESSEKLKIKD